MFSNGLPHMDVPVLANQPRRCTQKGHQVRWMIGGDGKKETEKPVLSAQPDDDDDDDDSKSSHIQINTYTGYKLKGRSSAFRLRVYTLPRSKTALFFRVLQFYFQSV